MIYVNNNKIKTILKEKKVPQKEICSFLGISKRALIFKLSGENEFTASQLLNLLDRYYIDLNDVIEHN